MTIQHLRNWVATAPPKQQTFCVDREVLEQILSTIDRLSNQAPPFKDGAPHNGADTSIEAALAVAPKAGAMRQVILDLFAQRGPMMCGEVEVHTGWTHQSVSARIRELVLEGELADTGRRQKFVRSGRSQRVYDLAPVSERLF